MPFPLDENSLSKIITIYAIKGYIKNILITFVTDIHGYTKWHKQQ